MYDSEDGTRTGQESSRNGSGERAAAASGHVNYFARFQDSSPFAQSGWEETIQRGQAARQPRSSSTSIPGIEDASLKGQLAELPTARVDWLGRYPQKRFNGNDGSGNQSNRNAASRLQPGASRVDPMLFGRHPKSRSEPLMPNS